MRPQADNPIVQLSLLKGSNEQDTSNSKLQLGQALKHFRDLGHAVVGGGGSCYDFEAAFKVAAGSGGNNPRKKVEPVRNFVGSMSFFEW
ncbi:hypothetical protein B0J13DRAFT_622349 [Dactylonectria estremocensis]|uniref:Uncharacterized protein n=1 Tax=Dactylonectria estremocensis TaxID=1079267 RepID=A0A9P9J7V9_9HYPO|nr:hypothetical protein B0J13DRAFT_622349 [Dactylonectria estremocensis]